MKLGQWSENRWFELIDLDSLMCLILNWSILAVITPVVTIVNAVICTTSLIHRDEQKRGEAKRTTFLGGWVPSGKSSRRAVARGRCKAGARVEGVLSFRLFSMRDDATRSSPLDWTARRVYINRRHVDRTSGPLLVLRYCMHTTHAVRYAWEGWFPCIDSRRGSLHYRRCNAVSRVTRGGRDYT